MATEESGLGRVLDLVVVVMDLLDFAASRPAAAVKACRREGHTDGGDEKKGQHGFSAPRSPPRCRGFATATGEWTCTWYQLA